VVLRHLVTLSIFAVAAILIGLFSYLILNWNSGNTIITLTDEGFKPKQMEIIVGDTITFRNKTDKLFWPASDVHPFHTDYEEFDPKRALDKDEEWSFTFNEVGKWNFHDHISPNHTGTIFVKTIDGKFAPSCFDVNNRDCWTNIITTTLELQGVDPAFDVLKEIHDTNPKFATVCHNYSHDIGLKSYRLYGVDVELSEKTSYCNAGFYHGFMEGFIDDNSDAKAIDDFCSLVGSKVNSGFGLAEGHCRHGIGHGAMEYLLYDTLEINNEPTETVTNAMKLCFATNNSEDMLMRCASGIYDTFRNWIYSYEGPTTIELADTLMDFCAVPKEWFVKRACYHELSKILTNLPNPDYTAQVFDFKAEIIPDDFEEYGPLAMRSFAINFGKRGVKERTHAELINFCRTADSNLQEACILGMFDGIQFAGTPGKEYVASSEFCDSDLLTSSEKKACFFDFEVEVSLTYPQTLWPEICNYIPEEFITDRVCRV